MEKIDTTQSKGVLGSMFDELGRNDIVKKVLQPGVDYVISRAKPYYTVTMISQIVIIILLLLVIYFTIVRK